MSLHGLRVLNFTECIGARVGAKADYRNYNITPRREADPDKEAKAEEDVKCRITKEATCSSYNNKPIFLKKQKSTGDLSSASLKSKRHIRKRTLSLSDIVAAFRNKYHVRDNQFKLKKRRIRRRLAIKHNKEDDAFTTGIERALKTSARSCDVDFTSSGDYFGFRSGTNQYSYHANCQYLNPFRKMKTNNNQGKHDKNNLNPHGSCPVKAVSSHKHYPVKVLASTHSNSITNFIDYNIVNPNVNNKQRNYCVKSHRKKSSSCGNCRRKSVINLPIESLRHCYGVTAGSTSLLRVLLNRRRKGHLLNAAQCRSKIRPSNESRCQCRDCNLVVKKMVKGPQNNTISKNKKHHKYVRLYRDNLEDYERGYHSPNKRLSLMPSSIEKLKEICCSSAMSKRNIHRSSSHGSCRSFTGAARRHGKAPGPSYKTRCCSRRCSDCHVGTFKFPHETNCVKTDKNTCHNSAKLYHVNFGKCRNPSIQKNKRMSVTPSSAEKLMKCCCNTVLSTIKRFLTGRSCSRPYDCVPRQRSKGHGSSYKKPCPCRECGNTEISRQSKACDLFEERRESLRNATTNDKNPHKLAKLVKYGSLHRQDKKLSVTPSSLERVRPFLVDTAESSSRNDNNKQHADLMFCRSPHDASEHSERPGPHKNRYPFPECEDGLSSHQREKIRQPQREEYVKNKNRQRYVRLYRDLEKYESPIETHNKKISVTPSSIERLRKFCRDTAMSSSRHLINRRSSSRHIKTPGNSDEICYPRHNMLDTVTSHNDNMASDFLYKTQEESQHMANPKNKDRQKHFRLYRDSFQKHGTRTNHQNKSLSVTPSSIEKLRKICFDRASCNRRLMRRGSSRIFFRSRTGVASGHKATGPFDDRQYGDVVISGPSDLRYLPKINSQDQVTTKNRNSRKYVRLYRDDSVKYDKKVSIRPSSLERHNYIPGSCFEDHYHYRKFVDPATSRSNIRSSLLQNETNPFKSSLKFKHNPQHRYYSSSYANRNRNLGKPSRLFQENRSEDKTCEKIFFNNSHSAQYRQVMKNNKRAYYSTPRNIAKNNKNENKFVRNVLLGIIVILWCPCVVTLALIWAVSYPLRQHHDKAGENSRPVRVHPKKRERCYLQKRPRTKYLEPKNIRVFNDPMHNKQKGFLASIVKWSTRAIGNAAASANAMLSTLRNKPVRGSPRFTSAHPNPEIKYSLFYAPDRGWVMRPVINNFIQRKLNQYNGTQIVHNMQFDSRYPGNRCQDSSNTHNHAMESPKPSNTPAAVQVGLTSKSVLSQCSPCDQICQRTRSTNDSASATCYHSPEKRISHLSQEKTYNDVTQQTPRKSKPSMENQSTEIKEDQLSNNVLPNKNDGEDRNSTKNGTLQHDIPDNTSSKYHPAAGDYRPLRPIRFLPPSDQLPPCRSNTFKLLRFPPSSICSPTCCKSKRPVRRVFHEPETTPEHSSLPKEEIEENEQKLEKIEEVTSTTEDQKKKGSKKEVFLEKFSQICKRFGHKVQKADAEMWPVNYQCRHMCAYKLRNNPLLFGMSPNTTPRVSGFSTICRNMCMACLYGATFLCWSPLICCFILCCQCAWF